MPLVWVGLILLCLLLYITLDGYDLGIGIATLFERDPQRRHDMLELVAITWDANETWLVLLAVAMWAGFPLAYSTILPHAYLAVIVMVFSLIVRGVSVEMASQKPPAPGWVKAFGIASLSAALMQGVVASTLVANVTIRGGAYTGSAFGAYGWYSALAAATVAAGYLAMGYAYTRWKTSGELRARAGHRGTLATTAAVILGGASLGAVNATAAPLMLNPGRLIPFIWLMAFAAAGIWTALRKLRPASTRFDALPTIGLSVAAVAGLLAVAVTRYPILVPPALTVYNALSPGRTMEFLAIGIGLDVPLILFYTWWAHYTFRGKLARAPQSHKLTRAQPVPAASPRQPRPPNPPLPPRDNIDNPLEEI